MPTACMNPTVSFETVGNIYIYWLAAFGKCLEPVGGKENSKLAVKDFSRRVQKNVKDVLTGILPLQMDGGKDVNLRKLIASCVVVGRNALLFDLHDTELGVLSATYYRNLVKKNIKAIMELMHVRWNYEPLMRVVQRLAPVEVDDDEDIPYD